MYKVPQLDGALRSLTTGLLARGPKQEKKAMLKQYLLQPQRAGPLPSCKPKYDNCVLSQCAALQILFLTKAVMSSTGCWQYTRTVPTYSDKPWMHDKLTPSCIGALA